MMFVHAVCNLVI